ALPISLVVSPGLPADYRQSHPERAALVVEVADASLSFDREHKGSLYARAGVQDYWIVNLVDHVLEVFRDPGPDPSALHGWRYRSATTLPRSTSVAPLAFPSSRIGVGDLPPSRTPPCRRGRVLADASLDRAVFAQLRDLRLRVAEAPQHLVGVLTQARRRGLDARAAVGELERGQRDRHGALDALDLLVPVQHAARLQLRIVQ